MMAASLVHMVHWKGCVESACILGSPPWSKVRPAIPEAPGRGWKEEVPPEWLIVIDCIRGFTFDRVHVTVIYRVKLCPMMRATCKTDATQWNSLWQILTTLDAVCKGSSLVWYLSTVQLRVLLAKAVQHCAIPGLYSGIFAMYLQHRRSQQSTNRANNILFYALWVLYALSVAISIIDILGSFWIEPVSMDDHPLLNLCLNWLYRTTRGNTTLQLSKPQYLVYATSLLNLS